MKRISAIEASLNFWASSPLVVVDAKAGLPEIPDIEKLESVSLWHGRVMDFGNAIDSKPYTRKAIASIGAIDDHIIMEVYDYEA